MKNGLTLKLRSKDKIIRFVNYSLKKCPEEYYRERLLLYIPWTKEIDILSQFTSYKDSYNHHKEAIMDKLRIYEPLSSILEQVEEDQQHDQTNIDVVLAPSTQYSDECDSSHSNNTISEPIDRIDIGHNLGIHTTHQHDPNNMSLIPTILSDHDYYAILHSLNTKQQEFHSHIINQSVKGEHTLCALHGGAGTGKSHVIKAIYQGLYRVLSKIPGQSADHHPVLLMAPTGKAAYNICGTTIHRALHIPANQKMQYKQLSWENLNILRIQLHHISWIIIDEMSMVGNIMLRFIHLRLQEIAGNKQPFGNYNIIFVGDLFQLQPVMQRYIFEDISTDYGPLSTNLWKTYFKVFELSQIMRQKDDMPFANLLNRLRKAKHTADDISMLKSRLISKETSLLLSTIPHFFPTKDSTHMYNEQIFHQSPETSLTITAIDSTPTDISANMQMSLLAAAAKKDVSSTANLPLKLAVKLGQIYDITSNIAVDDGIINGSECFLRHIQPNPNNPAFPSLLWVQFTDKKIGLKRRQLFSRNYKQHTTKLWTPIEAIQRSFTVKRDQRVSRTQFPLRLASARTIHVAQSSTYQAIVIDMSTSKKCPKQFWEHMHYVAFSRSTSLEGLHIVNINADEIRVSKKVLDYFEQHHNALLLSYTPSYSNPNTIVISYNNVGSLQHKWPALSTNANLTHSDIIILSETWCNSICQPPYSLPKFTTTHMPSTITPAHRGMLSFVNEQLQTSTITFQNIYLESIITLLQHGTTMFQFVAIYKPPTTTITQFKHTLHEVLSKINIDSPVILFGDFNINITDAHTHPFQNYMQQQYKLSLYTHEPTTWMNTTIDLVFSNVSTINAYALPTTWSMHHALFVTLPIGPSHTT